MGRHADTNSRGRLAPPVLVALVVVPLLMIGGVVWAVAGSGAAASSCGSTRGCPASQAIAPMSRGVKRTSGRFTRCVMHRVYPDRLGSVNCVG